MSATHTPGPWAPEDAVDNRVAVYARNRCVCLVGDQGDPVVDADARLIAAAPELLAALEIAEATLNRLAPDGSRATQGTRDIICAAITKARGEECS